MRNNSPFGSPTTTKGDLAAGRTTHGPLPLDLPLPAASADGSPTIQHAPVANVKCLPANGLTVRGPFIRRNHRATPEVGQPTGRKHLILSFFLGLLRFLIGLKIHIGLALYGGQPRYRPRSRRAFCLLAGNRPVLRAGNEGSSSWHSLTSIESCSNDASAASPARGKTSLTDTRAW